MRTSVGRDVEMHCGATGHPEPRVTWRRLIPGSDPQELQSGLSSATLKLASMSKSSAGDYECMAANDAEPAVFKRVSVAVSGTFLASLSSCSPQVSRIFFAFGPRAQQALRQLHMTRSLTRAAVRLQHGCLQSFSGVCSQSSVEVVDPSPFVARLSLNCIRYSGQRLRRLL